MRDLIEVIKNYRHIEVPVSYGEKPGKVLAVCNVKFLDVADSYISPLKTQINFKKYMDSTINGDVGPTIAVANWVNLGEYMDFIEDLRKKREEQIKIKKEISLAGMENVLEVVENGWIHHIMPKSSEMDFGNREQLSLMYYFAMERAEDSYDAAKADVIKNWSQKNGSLFRETLTESRKYTIPGAFNPDGSEKRYDNCIIFEGFYKRLLGKFPVDEKRAESIPRLELAMA